MPASGFGGCARPAHEWRNSIAGDIPTNDEDHRPLHAVRCPRWRDFDSAHAAVLELCCRDLSHPGRRDRAQQHLSFHPLTGACQRLRPMSGRASWRTPPSRPRASARSQRLAAGPCVPSMSTSMGNVPARSVTEKYGPPRRHRSRRRSCHAIARNGAKPFHSGCIGLSDQTRRATQRRLKPPEWQQAQSQQEASRSTPKSGRPLNSARFLYLAVAALVLTPRSRQRLQCRLPCRLVAVGLRATFKILGCPHPLPRL
jgi:hypothetical protein